MQSHYRPFITNKVANLWSCAWASVSSLKLVKFKCLSVVTRERLQLTQDCLCQSVCIVLLPWEDSFFICQPVRLQCTESLTFFFVSSSLKCPLNLMESTLWPCFLVLCVTSSSAVTLLSHVLSVSLPLSTLHSVCLNVSFLSVFWWAPAQTGEKCSSPDKAGTRAHYLLLQRKRQKKILPLHDWLIWYSLAVEEETTSFRSQRHDWRRLHTVLTN